MACCDESLALVKLIRIIYLSKLEVNALDIIDLIDCLFYFKGASRLTFITKLCLENVKAGLTSYPSLLHIAWDLGDLHLLLDFLAHFLFY